MKVYIIVRKDVNASVGKLMIHASHSLTDLLMKNGFQFDSPYRSRFVTWYKQFHQTKIILQVPDLNELTNIYGTISEKLDVDFPKAMIKDAGFYELEKGTIVCLAVGPLEKDEWESLGLNKLELYKKR